MKISCDAIMHNGVMNINCRDKQRTLVYISHNVHIIYKSYTGYTGGVHVRGRVCTSQVIMNDD